MAEPTKDLPTSLIVVIPALNEALTIAQTLTRLMRIGPKLAEIGVRLSVIVIDDGSTDGTGDIAAQNGVLDVVRHPVNRGLGAAVRSGLRAARKHGADIAVKMDADLQHDPNDIPALIAPILNGQADVVYGHRRLTYAMPMIRRWGNRFFTWVMGKLTHWEVADSQPGILAVNRDYLSVMRIPGNYNYTQQILLDAFHKEMRFTQVSVTFNERKTGKSFVSLKYPFKVMLQILYILATLRPMVVFVPVGMFFLSIAALVSGVQISEYLLGLSEKPIAKVNLVLGCGLFGLQTLFFGILAQLIADQRE